MGVGAAWPLRVRCRRKTFTFVISSPDEFLLAISYRPSVCRLSVCLSVCNVRAPYSVD